jgi:glycosyltransferase involved in cell wall biosynthesis
MHSKPKICIYAIAKNEEKFVERFMNFAREADIVIVADTGSSDDTVNKLRSSGAIVHSISVNPWRFDVARNMSLDFVPEDIDLCVCVDLDEVFSDGWREELEKVWNPKITQVKYKYIWNVLPNGDPGITFFYEKIHVRHGFKWKYPVHEVLVSDIKPHIAIANITLTHYPDNTKSRSSYLELLKLSCEEDPENDRNSHYLGREFMFHRQYENAIIELKRHLSLKSSTWNAERSASMRFISRCYYNIGNIKESINWAESAIRQHFCRESWLELAKIYYATQDWKNLHCASIAALTITDRDLNYISDPECWGALFYEYVSISAYYLGDIKTAVSYGGAALNLAPDDRRIKNNFDFLLSQNVKSSEDRIECQNKENL